MDSQDGDAGVQTPQELAAAIDAAQATAEAISPAELQLHRESFEASSAGAVRPQHAEEAVRQADDLQLLEYQDTGLLLATRLTTAGESSFTLLAVCARAEQSWQLIGAYRLYGPDAEDLASDSGLAFQTLLLRFGLQFRAGDRWVWFVPVLVTEAGSQGGGITVELKPDDADWDWSVSAMARGNAEGTTTLAWPYVLNVTGYRADLRRHRRR